MPKKNTRNTKSKIVSAAWRLFYQQGYDDTTIEGIIYEAGRPSQGLPASIIAAPESFRVHFGEAPLPLGSSDMSPTGTQPTPQYMPLRQTDASPRTISQTDARSIGNEAAFSPAPAFGGSPKCSWGWHPAHGRCHCIQIWPPAPATQPNFQCIPCP